MLPAAAFAGMVLSAADEAMGPGDHTLEDMSFREALFLPEQGARAVQLVLSARGVGETSFRFFSQEGGRHAAGRVVDAARGGYDPPPLFS